MLTNVVLTVDLHSILILSINSSTVHKRATKTLSHNKNCLHNPNRVQYTKMWLRCLTCCIPCCAFSIPLAHMAIAVRYRVAHAVHRAGAQPSAATGAVGPFVSIGCTENTLLRTVSNNYQHQYVCDRTRDAILSFYISRALLQECFFKIYLVFA